ncbi:MAG TPA: hypothetical protein VF815_40695 [Myxococcaceae bacterium]|jgi:hypothetical protein
MVYLQITLKISPANRPEAAGVYQRYKASFLETISTDVVTALKPLLDAAPDVRIYQAA